MFNRELLRKEKRPFLIKHFSRGGKMVNNNFLRIAFKVVATLFIAVNYCFGILYPSEFMGFHKFTRKDARIHWM